MIRSFLALFLLCRQSTAETISYIYKTITVSPEQQSASNDNQGGSMISFGQWLIICCLLIVVLLLAIFLVYYYKKKGSLIKENGKSTTTLQESRIMNEISNRSEAVLPSKTETVSAAAVAVTARTSPAATTSTTHTTNHTQSPATQYSQIKSTQFSSLQTTMVPDGPILALPGERLFTINSDFQILTAFGKGGGGELFTGRLLKQGDIAEFKTSLCAVKVVTNGFKMNEEEFKASFEQEVSIMWQLRGSPNIIQFFGFCYSPYMLVMKYYEIGNLDALIFSTGPLIIENQHWNTKFVYKLLYDIASGLKFIHENGFVHRDVKTLNILLEKTENKKLRALIADFGMAAIVEREMLKVKAYQESKLQGGSLIYLSPELMQSFISEQTNLSPNALCAADVYAFSIVAYQVFTRQYPYSKDVPPSVLVKNVMEGKRPILDQMVMMRRREDAKIDKLCSVMEQCWQQEWEKRPKFGEILQMLFEKKEETQLSFMG